MVGPIKLPKEQKEQIISSLQDYFQEERGEELSHLGAELMVDFMLKEIGPFVYNKAISDVRTMMNEMASRIDEELYTLEKPIVRR